MRKGVIHWHSQMEFAHRAEHEKTRYIFRHNYLPHTVKAKPTKNGFTT
jgi:hypothetical protein